MLVPFVNLVVCATVSWLCQTCVASLKPGHDDDNDDGVVVVDNRLVCGLESTFLFDYKEAFPCDVLFVLLFFLFVVRVELF